jgi:hypothetical protein
MFPGVGWQLGTDVAGHLLFPFQDLTDGPSRKVSNQLPMYAAHRLRKTKRQPYQGGNLKFHSLALNSITFHLLTQDWFPEFD